MFKVDYTVEVAGNKEFGSVFLQKGQQQENVALTIVQNGWAKVCHLQLLGCGSCNDMRCTAESGTVVAGAIVSSQGSWFALRWQSTCAAYLRVLMALPFDHVCFPKRHPCMH